MTLEEQKKVEKREVAKKRYFENMKKLELQDLQTEINELVQERLSRSPQSLRSPDKLHSK